MNRVAPLWTLSPSTIPLPSSLLPPHVPPSLVPCLPIQATCGVQVCVTTGEQDLFSVVMSGSVEQVELASQTLLSCILANTV